GMSGVEGVKALREHWAGSVIVMLTAFGDDDNVFRSICNGACGYLLKKTPPARLLEAIREAAGGGAPMTPEIARRVIELFQKSAPPAQSDLGLTPQEVNLLRLLAEGHSYQAAGEQMHVSINTVRNYIRSIYDKLHVHSKSQAVSKALKAGVI
ncbi:MAG: response regulator transcription factor, partial [Phycisphaerales bacterium]|nr:response regulator transcription factor [Phycisphaerales bacterium]